MSGALRNYAEQALHYYRREHTSVPRQPLQGRSAWRGHELQESESWLETLNAEELAELERAGRSSADLPVETLRREDVPLPTLSRRIASWRDELSQGRGFLVIRGLPVSRWGDALSARAYWALGLHLGVPGAQNPTGEHLGHVTDYGEDASQPFVRRYRTAGDIAYHCDLADVVGLLCLRTGRTGGRSRIASSVAVYNALLDARPDLVDRLFEPMKLDLRGEGGGSGRRWLPVTPCCHAEGVLRTFYHSDYFRSVVRHDDVAPFTRQEQELFDTYEALAESPELRLEMQFQQGDIQLLSNHFVLHARAAYEDGADAGERRHLLRLWLSLH